MLLLLFWSLLAAVLADTYTPPNKPRKVEVQAVNSTTIFVEWLPPRPHPEDRTGTIRGYYVHYAELDENNDTIISTEETKDTKDESRTEMVIYGLKPNTKYQVNVAGYTNEGDGIVSRPTIISTKGAVPSKPRYLKTELVQLYPPIAKVSWFKPQFVNGELTGYRLYLGKKGEVYERLSFKPNQQSYITRTLDMDSLYDFRVLARNEIDFGERAVSRLATPTWVSSSETGPQNVATIRLSPTTLQILWDEPNPDYDIASYRVYYNQYGIEDMSLWDHIDTEEPTRVALLTGLSPHAPIVIRMQTKYINDRWSNLTEIITSAILSNDRADVVQSFLPMNVTSRQMTLSWDKPRKEEVAQYVIKYQGEKSYNNSGVEERSRTQVHSLRVPRQKDNIVIKDLQPRTVYQFNITARFNDGSTGPQQSFQYQTQIEAPTFVPPPKFVRVVKGRIILALKPASDINGRIAYYELMVIPEEYTVKRPQDFTEVDLNSHRMPIFLPATSPYIAVRFHSRRLPAEFELGNKKVGDGFFNHPLDADNRYRAFLRAYTVKKAFKSSAYSEYLYMTSGHNQTNCTQKTSGESKPNSKNDTHEQTADGEAKVNKIWTSNDLIDAQYKYFEKQTKLTAVQKQYFAQRTRTEAIREKYLQKLVNALEKGQKLHDHDI